MTNSLKVEWLGFPDGSVRLTTVFESRADMEKFREVYDKFVALFPEPASAVSEEG